MSLTDEHIAEIAMQTWGCASIAPRHAPAFARAIESKVAAPLLERIAELERELEAVRKEKQNETQQSKL
jgi:hypothetical protein